MNQCGKQMKRCQDCKYFSRKTYGFERDLGKCFVIDKTVVIKYMSDKCNKLEEEKGGAIE